MNLDKSDLVSSYLQYLPAILQEDPFMGRFLLAFEKVLSGVKDLPSDEKIIQGNSDNVSGLEEVINRVETYFDPQETPEQFLPWLAGWVALSLRDDWEIKAKRAFIQEIVRLYQKRGTKDGLTEVLKLYLVNSGFGDKVKIFDEFDNFPHYFQVQLTLNDRDPEKYWRQSRIAKAIIDQEKPAHTFYSLKILVPTMQLTKRSQVNYPFKLFNDLKTQDFTLKVAIIPQQITRDKLEILSKQLVVKIQGNTTEITPYSSLIATDDQAFYVKQQITYQQFLDNLGGFNVILSNQTDNFFLGRLKVTLFFELNGNKKETILLEQPLNLSPVLKLCSQDKSGKIIGGNTILKQAQAPEISGMQITKSLWTNPYNFILFDLPIMQKFELEATLQINQPEPLTENILNQITVCFQDENSSYHLLTPETIIQVNKIIIKRQLSYPQLLDVSNKLKLIIKNLNNVETSGKASVTVKMNINQIPVTFNLFEQDLDFKLAAVPPKDTLKICYEENGKIITKDTKGTVFTVLGTQ
ncbi:MAG: phage tail protein [Snowella sp.]|nr:phage tail protein [Snowella sp.]